jgi:hypothetical protein
MFAQQQKLILSLLVLCLLFSFVFGDECVCICQEDRRLTKTDAMSELLKGGMVSSIFQRLLGKQ